MQIPRKKIWSSTTLGYAQGRWPSKNANAMEDSCSTTKSLTTRMFRICSLCTSSTGPESRRKNTGKLFNYINLIYVQTPLFQSHSDSALWKQRPAACRHWRRAAILLPIFADNLLREFGVFALFELTFPLFEQEIYASFNNNFEAFPNKVKSNCSSVQPTGEEDDEDDSSDGGGTGWDAMFKNGGG